MTRINRRRLLQLSGAGALAAGTGGLAGILASGRAPAYGQTATVHWLRWADFVPASDVLLKGPIVAQCQKDLGIKLTVETINANDIQARVTSAIQSGTGPDIIMGLNNWPQLYADEPRRRQRSRRATRQGAAAAITISARWSAPTATTGSACPGAPAAGSSPIASPGWPRPAPRNSRRTGTITAPSARS